MSTQIVAVALIGTLFAAVLAWQLVVPWRRARRRERLLAAPLSASWRDILTRNFVLYGSLPDDLRARLDGLINVFLAEKRFVGCNGLTITDEIRVTIAAQACTLIANHGDGCFDDLQTVLVYPRAFYVDQKAMDEYGVMHESTAELAGESWEEGRVIVSWDDARDGGRQAADGMNVVMHEFAHQLDGLSGEINGTPPLPDEAAYERWARTFNAAYRSHCGRVERERETLIDPYGATDPAEFFAVATECFFERAVAFRMEQPVLYARLAEYYRQDPASWARA